MTSADFYLLRDLRTAEFVKPEQVATAPVGVGIGATAQTKIGQILLLSLANQLARIHRHITFSGAFDVPLQIRMPLCQGETLRSALESQLRSIDPYGTFRLLDKRDTHATVSLGIGQDVSGAQWYVGANESMGCLSREPSPVLATEGTVRGAALASCLGAASVLRCAAGLAVVPRTLSSWNWREGEYGVSGPSDIRPINVGRVLLLGGGAVASALVYWSSIFGIDDHWTIVDGDVVKYHNLNRSLVFSVSDAGWPNLDAIGINKALACCHILPGSTPVTHFDDEVALSFRDFDVVICLANERDVRHRAASRNPPIALQATTGHNWLAQLHRHIAGVDDCIACRTAGVQKLQLGCSAASLDEAPGESSSDAALPFLSATSGLMLATALQRLTVGDLQRGEHNDWRLDFDSTHRMASRGIRNCRSACTTLMPIQQARALYGAQRWFGLRGA